MYDSDEVRNAVRNEIIAGLQNNGDWNAASPIELAALIDTWNARFMELMEPILQAAAEVQAAIGRIIAAFTEWFESFGRAVMEGIAAGVNEATAKIAWQPPWAARPRRVALRPVQLVDAVAAGRHPAMILRNRRVGGRR